MIQTTDLNLDALSSLIVLKQKNQCFSWTTPVAKRKVSRRESAGATPSRHRDNLNSDAGIIRNLMQDLSLNDEEEKTANSEQDCKLQDILVQGVSNLTVKETNKLFPKAYQQPPDLCGINIKDAERSPDPLPLPISSPTPAARWPLSSTPNEPRQRYSKPSPSDTTVNIDPQPRARGVRRYFSFQVLRWLLLFILVWVIYFSYLYFHAEILLPPDRHL